MEPGHAGHKIEAYVAVSPKGACIMGTINITSRRAWAALCNCFPEPDRLHAAGWRVHRIECTVMEVAE